MTLQQEINNLTWHNAINKLKSILIKLLLNFNNIQGFIPYTGTKEPMIGVFEVQDVSLKSTTSLGESISFEGDIIKVGAFDFINYSTIKGGLLATAVNNGSLSYADESLNITSIDFSSDGINITDDILNRGLKSDTDFSSNAEDLDYIQKIFVTTNFGTLISLTTTEINALTPIEGKLYYNNTLKVVVFYNGTAWQKLSFTAM